MAIVDEDLERLRATLVLSDVVQQYVALRRVGRTWVGLCPFHAERTPSFNVRDETGHAARARIGVHLVDVADRGAKLRLTMPRTRQMV